MSGRLTFRKFNSLGCTYLISIPYLRKANIPLQNCVFSGNDEKRDFQENDAVPCSQKVVNDKVGDNNSKICNGKPATCLSPEDSNCMGAAQSSGKAETI